jgi:hypothetical protein
MRARSAIALVLLIASLAGSSVVSAQEVEFRPRYDGIVTKKRSVEGTPTPIPESVVEILYSFERWRPQMSEICRLLEVDHRRERVFLFVNSQLKLRPKNTSYRSLLHEARIDCASRSTSKGRSSPTPRKAKDGEEVAIPTPIPTPVAARYPSTELVNYLSAVSIEMYKRDPGVGGTFEAVSIFMNTLLAEKDLTPAERDYFEIVRAFFLASWDGRPGGPLEPTPVSRERIRELFQ